MSQTDAPPVAHLAGLIGGIVTADHQIVTTAGLVYCNPWGVVKLQRFGVPVLALGAWHDVAGVAAAYCEAVGHAGHDGDGACCADLVPEVTC